MGESRATRRMVSQPRLAPPPYGLATLGSEDTGLVLEHPGRPRRECSDRVCFRPFGDLSPRGSAVDVRASVSGGDNDIIGRMDKVLDLDLDFFVWPTVDDTGRHGVSKRARPPKTRFTRIATELEVSEFLEKQCGLSKAHKLPGREAKEHIDAFSVWREWLIQGRLSLPFTVVHVDAHSDLGSGLNNTFHYISTGLLSLPLESRRCPTFGPRHLNSGNYLAGAIANRWVQHLTYVYPSDPEPSAPPPDDLSEAMTSAQLLRALRRREGLREETPQPPFLPEWCFRDGRIEFGIVELRRFQDGPNWHMRDPLSTEPPVEFRTVEDYLFSETEFTHMFLAQSPQYVPKEADALLDVIREYFVKK